MVRGKTYARLAFVGGIAIEPRIKGQSTSGHRDSQRTFPPDSRSISIAKDSAQERDPYATLRKCPVVVLQDDAKVSRSSTDMAFQKSSSSMTDYHHAVIGNATPNGVFTKRCQSNHNRSMQNTDADTRRANLARLIDQWYEGNRSAIARDYNPKEPKPQYFSDLLRVGSGKSFAEKAARKIEEAVGLQRGQLDIPDSPLLRDVSKRDRLKDELRLAIDELDREGQRDALSFIRGRKRKAS